MRPVPFALALTVVLGLLTVIQLALVFGAPLGRFAWGGQHRVLPARLRVGSAVSILIYAVIALIAWDRVGAINLFGEPFPRSRCGSSSGTSCSASA